MRSIILDKKAFQEDPDKFESLVKFSHFSLSSLSTFYPTFDKWYFEKVYAGLYNGERKILLHYLGNNLAGIAILKSTSYEKKLCCLRVTPSFYGSGVGLKLFSESFKYLETERPLLSVSEEQLPIFHRIFNHFSFEIGDEYRDLYRKKKNEISFNGLLKIEKKI